MSGFAHLSRIALGLTSISCVLLVALDLAGLVPDQQDAVSRSRSAKAEAIVRQATISATLDDMSGLRSLLEVASRRDDDVLSVALRDPLGRLRMATREHRRLWVGAPDEGSSHSHMRMPIFHEGEQWATLEIRFASAEPLGILRELWERPATRLVLCMAALGFLANLVFVRRILRHLDPSEVVPARVQTTLDVMADGVLLVDDEERVVLANAAFCERLQRSPSSLVGMPASSLPWQLEASPARSAVLPWLAALEEGGVHENVPVSIGAGADAVEFRVNASPVLDGWERAKGAIVTFRDVTQLERQRRELEQALTELGKSRDEIRLKNEELELLAQTDSLTGIANRRTFMHWYEEQFALSQVNREPLSVLMVDIDFFKKVNDEYGHAMGDEVICRVAQLLQDQTRSTDIAGRYGGEEFCVALLGMTTAQAAEAGESIREAVAAPGFARVPVTVSVGASSTELGAGSPGALLEEADAALYASKGGGRNRVTRFDALP